MATRKKARKVSYRHPAHYRALEKKELAKRGILPMPMKESESSPKTITQCTFSNNAAQMNKHASKAAVALAKAAEANALAIQEIAKCIQGGQFNAPMVEMK